MPHDSSPDHSSAATIRVFVYWGVVYRPKDTDHGWSDWGDWTDKDVACREAEQCQQRLPEMEVSLRRVTKVVEYDALDAAPGIRGSSHRPTGEARGEGNEPLTGAAEEVASHVAALDSLETILFGDCWRRSRDELEARATDLVAKEKNLDATLRLMP